MEYQRKLIEDFMKEVDGVVERVNAAKVVTVHPFSPAEGAAPSWEDVSAARREHSRLEHVVAELERRLESESLKFETEALGRAKLEERQAELAAENRALRETAENALLESRARAARLAELEKTLEASELGRAQLILALQEQKSQTGIWHAEAEAWKGRHDELAPKLREKEEALSAASQRYEDACRIFKDEMSERVREIHRLNGEAARARAHEEELQAQTEKKQKQIDEERERLRLQADRAMDNAESIRRDVFAAVESQWQEWRKEMKEALTRIGGSQGPSPGKV